MTVGQMHDRYYVPDAAKARFQEVGHPGLEPGALLCGSAHASIAASMVMSGTNAAAARPHPIASSQSRSATSSPERTPPQT